MDEEDNRWSPYGGLTAIAGIDGAVALAASGMAYLRKLPSGAGFQLKYAGGDECQPPLNWGERQKKRYRTSGSWLP